ncbi:MAG TPA: tRNA (adenosine(37)-N6)-threonylcarbamoyltransferase complex ATPase subunit type 1 TsaE [Candidatus Cybelea sp.]
MHLTLHDEEETRAFGQRLAPRLRAGDVVALSGPLGSGKTTLVRAIVRALAGSDPSSSPTFTFWHRYGGDPPIDHIDLFRIDDPRETVELGLEEAFDGGSIVLVEWWRNAPDLIPQRRYEIEMEGAGNDPRRLVLRDLR